MLKRIAVTLIVAFMALSGSAAQAADVGLIASVTGDVKVMDKPGAKWGKASVMQTLVDGSSIKVEPNSGAVIVLFHGGERYQLAPNSVAALTADTCRSVSGPPPKTLPALHIRQAKQLQGSRVASGRAASTVLRGGMAHIELQGLSATSILEARPVFKWSAVPDAASYKVRLWNDADEIIWQSEAQMTSLAYPADAPTLKPGMDYLWTVSTTVKDTLFKGEGIFRVLPPEKQQAVKDELAALGALDDEAISGVLRAEVFARHELWDDAVTTYQQLVEKFPNAAAIREALAALLAGQARGGESRRQQKAAAALAN